MHNVPAAPSVDQQRPADTPRRVATAGMPLPVLVQQLARIGWAGLPRNASSALRALAEILPARSAEGESTVGEVATRANYGERQTRGEALPMLEQLGIVTWQRGGVVGGKATRSRFRVSKRRLADLINAGRDAFAEAVAAIRAATARRVAGLRDVVRRRRRSGHAAVIAYTSPQEVEVPTPPPLRNSNPASLDHVRASLASMRAALRAH